MTKLRRTLIASGSLCFCAASGWAQTTDTALPEATAANTEGAYASAATGEVHEGHSKHQVEFGLFATRDHHGETAPTLGVSYHYRLNPSFSIGALGEYAFGEIETGVVGIPLTLHVGEGLQFVAMPGLEIDGSHRESLFRVGLGYEFELENRMFVKPEVNADFVDGEVNYVLGVSLGFGF